MKKSCFTVTVVALFTMAQIAMAATSISLGPNNVLSVLDSQGSQVAALNSGSISEKVSADSQAFKISFGQDLQNRHTIIVYPDPENPQSLDLTILNQSVQMTQDSVLTITANADGTAAQFKSGVLGNIVLANSPISPGSSLSIQNGQVLSSTPAELTENQPAPTQFENDSYTVAAPSPSGTFDPLASNFEQGLIVKEVTGTVVMTPQGTNALDSLRDSTNIPKLKTGDVIPVGSSIRTDFSSSVIVAQSPGVTIEVLPNTNIQFRESEYKIEGGVEKRVFKADMQKGGVLNNLQGTDPQNTVFQIRTPLAVAAARGTSFAVYTSATISVIIGNSGTVAVTTDSNVISVAPQEKIVVTRSGLSGEVPEARFSASFEETQVIQDFVATSNRLNPADPNFGSGLNGPSNSQSLQDQAQQILDDAVDDFQTAVTPTLNPGAITPTTSP